MGRPSSRWRRGWRLVPPVLAAVVLPAVLLLSACSAGSTPTRAAPSRPDVAALDRAVDGLNRTRAPVLADTTALLAGAAALDRADALAAAGNSDELARSYDAAHAAAAAAAAALSQLGPALASYADALDQLGRVAQGTGYAASQQQALAAVVGSGETERRALEGLTASAAAGWPAYAALDASEGSWLTRARGGWYRSVPESANAYAVLVSAGRSALETARSTLARSDAARVERRSA